MFKCRVGYREHCPQCGTHVVYSKNSWHKEGGSALPIEPAPHAPKKRIVSVPSYNPQRKVVWSTNSEALVAIVISFICALVAILMRIMNT